MENIQINISMQCAGAILSPVACLTLQYNPMLYHKWKDFRKGVCEHKMCVRACSGTGEHKYYELD
jgi:hypothetical protein